MWGARREHKSMTITGPDHFTILTIDTEMTVAFYAETLGLRAGPRPDFAFPGAWLYAGGAPLLHIVRRETLPAPGGVIDHIAFRATGLAALLERLKTQGVSFDLRRLPAGAGVDGVWHVLFTDPNGARIEVNFDASETL
jgi:catechol 2,3-dioxygenase-like lactoylglutathione lyase family enzyme